MFSLMRQAVAREGGFFDDLEVIRTWLAGHERCSGRIGAFFNTYIHAPTEPA